MMPLLIRADASTEIGTGHVMRCLALAQAWQDRGGQVVFLCAQLPPGLQFRLCNEGMQVRILPTETGTGQDAAKTAQTAKGLGCEWVVVDGYQFSAGYQKNIKNAGVKLLFIDDYGHASHYCADLVLNQNLHASMGTYPSREPGTLFLLGTRYVLLRREFLRWRGWTRKTPEVVKKLLVTMGGSDPGNVTGRVLEALPALDLDDLEVVAVVGAGNPHLSSLRQAIARSPRRIRLETNVKDMPAVMAWADMAISAGGSTIWELAFMGLPSLLIILAENQREMTTKLSDEGGAVTLNSPAGLGPSGLISAIGCLLANKCRRKTMTRTGRAIVDGEGAERAISRLCST